MEKHHSMSDELGRDAGSVSALQRKHQNFLQDLMTLQSQVTFSEVNKNDLWIKTVCDESGPSQSELCRR